MNDFRSTSVSWIRSHAREMADQEVHVVIRFAAHLFAIASLLGVGRGDLQGTPESAVSLQDAARRLTGISPGITAPDLYLVLLDALLTVQDVLDVRRDSATLERPTELIPVIPDTRHALGGWVYHWLRPIPALSRERDLRYEEALEGGRPPAPAERPNDHLDRLVMFWRKSLQPPEIVPPPSRASRRLPLVEESGRDAQSGSFRIALCPLLDTIYPLFALTPGGRHFRVRRPEGMTKPGELQAHLSRVIEAAADQKVQLVIFPELTVSCEARDYLVGTLRANRKRWPYGVVAGSFHEWPDPMNATQPPWNEARLLDHKGNPLLRHQKKKGFRLHVDQVKKAPHFFPGFCADHITPGVFEIFEDIEDGSTFAVLDTSLGRLALLICFDALAADPRMAMNISSNCCVRISSLLFPCPPRPRLSIISSIEWRRIGLERCS